MQLLVCFDQRAALRSRAQGYPVWHRDRALRLPAPALAAKRCMQTDYAWWTPTPSPENASTSHRRALAPQSRPSEACHQTHEPEGGVTRDRDPAPRCGDRPCGSQRCDVVVCITRRKRTQEALSSPDAHLLSDGPTSSVQRSSAVLPQGRKSRRSFEWNSKQEVAAWNQRRIGGCPRGGVRRCGVHAQG